MSILPKDPHMFYSFINLKLRDYYKDLDALCDDLDVSKETLVKTLQEAGYEYKQSENRFV